jgi:hypothetical protein
MRLMWASYSNGSMSAQIGGLALTVSSGYALLQSWPIGC